MHSLTSQGTHGAPLPGPYQHFISQNPKPVICHQHWSFFNTFIANILNKTKATAPTTRKMAYLLLFCFPSLSFSQWIFSESKLGKSNVSPSSCFAVFAMDIHGVMAALVLAYSLRSCFWIFVILMLVDWVQNTELLTHYRLYNYWLTIVCVITDLLLFVQLLTYYCLCNYWLTTVQANALSDSNLLIRYHFLFMLIMPLSKEQSNGFKTSPLLPFAAFYCSHNDRTISAKAGLITCLLIEILSRAHAKGAKTS